jgi:hypothetical protein
MKGKNTGFQPELLELFISYTGVTKTALHCGENLKIFWDVADFKLYGMYSR